MFSLIKASARSQARRATLATRHGKFPTPFFMPIATKGAVKTVGTDDLEKLGASIILSNTYHLMLRPGEQVLKAAGGLHGLMNWQKPILTDSGGYQVLSLAPTREVRDDGVLFRSHLDGSEHLLTPERSQEVQEAIGSDLAMILDDLVDYPVTRERVIESVTRTTKWAKRQKNWFSKNASAGRELWGIVQGSTSSEFRRRAVEEIVGIDFDGYAHGGLSVGEERPETYELVSMVNEILPADKIRYFMGAGKPEEIVEYVRRGVDCFDCVLPTRNARHGTLYVWRHDDFSRPDFYEVYHAGNESHRLEFSPVDKTCDCLLCARYTRAYLRHLFSVEEPLALRLSTLHNICFYLRLMERIRGEIETGKL
ncbi:tRNA guanosine(34) transglycosylase Tgt [Patescibacteria group bacterium]|nr:MAG: tRNA guanosine(34) transglycosylase Tgt [Patescibacteria group bacterium]